MADPKSATLCWLVSSEIAMLVFGLALVIGLVGEYAKSERWKKYIKVFELMVILGVAGEILADGGVFLFSWRLMTISDAEVARFKDVADKAGERAAKAESHLDEADAAAKEANARAAQAESGLARFKAPRTLGPEQQRHIVAKCKASPAEPFVLLVDPSPEAIDFVNVVEGLLDSCGWTIRFDDVFGFAATTRKGSKVRTIQGEQGVMFLFSPDKIAEFAPSVKNLASAFGAEGIDVKVGTNTTLGNPSAIYIVIGTKPQK